MVNPPTELAFLTTTGERRRRAARFGPDRPAGPPGLTARPVLLDGARTCLQIRVAGPGDRTRALDLLATQTATALRLHRQLAGDKAALLFPEPLGHDLDAAEPFVLYRPPRGQRAADLSGLSNGALRTVERDLVRAVQLLERFGLVHHGITPGTVRWDGSSVQLWGLHAVTRPGRPRAAGGAPPYAAPEVRLGTGAADPRDALWSCAQLMYHLLTGRHGDPDRAPGDLAEYPALAHPLGQAFAPRAADRPTPAELLKLLDPARLPQDPPRDELATGQAEFDRVTAHKRSLPAAGAPTPSSEEAPAPAPAAEPPRRCPYCLEPIAFDPRALVGADGTGPVDPAAVGEGLRQADRLYGLFQRCTADPEMAPHDVPVPYLVNGRPLTIAMVGETSSGKSHLLTQMIAEITDGRLEPYGISWRPTNRDLTAEFARDRVAPLRSGEVLGHTAVADDHAEFVEALLLTDAQHRTRPVAFFDLAGEDLVRTNRLLGFLLDVDALIFVVDPAMALPFAGLDEIRSETGVEVQPNGDQAFATVLNRLASKGALPDVPSALVLGKADLLRLEHPVDRWLDAPPNLPFDPARQRAESRDVFALLHQHAGRAWLRPFDSLRRCSLHVASATGGRQHDGRYRRRVRAQRVLEPLVSILAMHGMVSEVSR
ncbi:TRAFAC clade GTPase domain-containing protein [Kitasatospora viridis]|uniref:Double-GTPase 2 domain-containing protein n=1 Tax=Kitasatospora viridis TaxID=281105 RepID=A0A561SFH2_9ACTN|nr:hypothetical protein [Kitasatospora viridis]TWF73602.1 hypothetical protein FHX73_15215 [Kitasatospora viridis]